MVHLGSELPHELRLASPPLPLRLDGRGVEKGDNSRGRAQGRCEGFRGGQEQGAVDDSQARAAGRGDGGRPGEEDWRREGDVWYETKEYSVGPALPPVTSHARGPDQRRHEPTSPFFSPSPPPDFHFPSRLPPPFWPVFTSSLSLHYVSRLRPRARLLRLSKTAVPPSWSHAFPSSPATDLPPPLDCEQTAAQHECELRHED